MSKEETQCSSLVWYLSRKRLHTSVKLFICSKVFQNLQSSRREGFTLFLLDIIMMKKIVLFLSAVLMAVSCSKSDENEEVIVSGLSLNFTSLSMIVGESKTLSATVIPQNASNKTILWSSSNAAVATVIDGIVEALSPGTAIITAKSADVGKSASCTIDIDLPAAANTGDIKALTPINATISGNVQIPNKVNSDFEYGIITAQTSEPIIEIAERHRATNSEKGYFEVDVLNLYPDSEYYYRSYIVNNSVVVYGDIKSFRTPTISSIFRTLDAGSISETKGIIKAALDTNELAYNSFNYGFRWGEQENNMHNTVLVDNLSDKEYSFQMEGLSIGKEYFFQAYCLFNNHEYVSEIKSFVTNQYSVEVSADSATNITEYKATFHGKLDIKSIEQPENKVWFQYYETDYPSASQTVESVLNEDGTFDAIVTGLKMNTSYKYIARAKVFGKTKSSNSITFSTNNPIKELSIDDASEVSQTKATLKGRVAFSNIEDVNKNVWFCYDNQLYSDKSVLSSRHRTLCTPDSDGSIHVNIQSLSPNETWYYMACAKVNDNMFYSDIKSFTTNNIEVRIETLGTSNVSEKRASIHGKLDVSDIGNMYKNVWFLYGESKSEIESQLHDENMNKHLCQLNDDGTFSEECIWLSSNTTYYYVAVAEVQGNIGYGEIKSFTTYNPSFNVITKEATNVSEFNATLNGVLEMNCVSHFDAKVWFLLSNFPDIEYLKTYGQKIECDIRNNGEFSITEKVYPNGQYYYVACADIEGNVIYGEVQPFKTNNIEVSFSSLSATNISEDSVDITGKLSIKSTDKLYFNVVISYSYRLDFLFGGHDYRLNNNPIDEDSFSITLPSLDYNHTYYYQVAVQIYGEATRFHCVQTIISEKLSFQTANRPEMIDLGLSVKWRSWNLGASSPPERGDFYAWGENQTQSFYGWSWKSYKWSQGNENILIKYNTDPNMGNVDNITKLQNEDDVAHTQLGGLWRMPTKEEYQELLDNCTREYIPNIGVKFTSKKNGYSDQWILFPPSGCYTERNYIQDTSGGSGFYWSSSLDVNKPMNACSFYFSTPGGQTEMQSSGRWTGMVIRPVSD